MSNDLMRIEFKPEQVELIKKTIAPSANDNELKLFLYQCQRTGLDPLTRQIYCIHRGGKMTIQTSIDGFRVIAERSGTYAGQDEPIFTYDDNKKLVSAKVTVYRFAPNGTRYPASVGVAFWNEYAGQNLWVKMPHTMLAKVAEALALRKAYPQDLSGLYSMEEMEQADEKENKEEVKEEAPTEEFIDYVLGFDYSSYKQDQLLRLLDKSTFEGKARDSILNNINVISQMTEDKFYKIKKNLEDNQLGIDGVANPSAKDINNHVRKIAQS